MKRTAFLLTAALLLSTSAQAWGPKEQSALAGAAGVLLLQHVFDRKDNNQPNQTVRPLPHTQKKHAPASNRQPPVIIVNQPQGNHYYGAPVQQNIYLDEGFYD